MKILDCFSGIGGFSYAAHQVFDDAQTVAFVEIDKKCQEVLHRIFPNVPIIKDIKEVSKEVFGEIDILTAGFPCQPASTAGKRKGKEDERWLFPYLLKVIKDTKPRWILLENVSGLLTLEQGMAYDGILADLEEAGYTVRPFVIPASAVGAWHLRYRVWFVGYRGPSADAAANNAGGRAGEVSSADEQEASQRQEERIQFAGHADSRSGKDVDDVAGSRCHGGCKSTTPKEREERSEEDGEHASDTGGAGLSGGTRPENDPKKTGEGGKGAYRPGSQFHSSVGLWQFPWLQVAGRLCRDYDGLSLWVDLAIACSVRYGYSKKKAFKKEVRDKIDQILSDDVWCMFLDSCVLQLSIPEGCPYIEYVSKFLHDVVLGQNEGGCRIKMLGNSIVPQVAVEIFKVIKACDGKPVSVMGECGDVKQSVLF